VKSKLGRGAASPLAGAGDAKVNNILGEMDRFFKSVHADIEDWKFSMEDYGDGTRVFVRFQLHFNRAGAPRPPAGAKAAGPEHREAHDRELALSTKGGRTLPDGRAVTEDLHEPDASGAARRADLDVASFVEVWRGKKDSSSGGGAYHKEGAPYLDVQSEWKGHKRSAAKALPETT
jgi:hypothetical protein